MKGLFGGFGLNNTVSDENPVVFDQSFIKTFTGVLRNLVHTHLFIYNS